MKELYQQRIELADSRGHNAERLTLKPSFGNLILWKSIYQHEEKFYVDAIQNSPIINCGVREKILECLIISISSTQS